MSSGGGGGGIGGTIGGIVGGIIGGGKASGDRAAGQGYAEQAFQELMALGMPPDLSKEIIMQKFQEAGILTPELEQEINIAHSKQAELQEAPETRQAQMEALRTLQQQSKTGLGAQDRAALNQVRDQVQRDLEGKRQQILQSRQQRGMGGSGDELISQLQASQGGANQASMESDRLAAMAQERALAALGQSANLAGSVRGQDYQAAQNRAQAADELSRFNVSNQQQQQMRNIAAKNIAQAGNLQNKQNIMNKNIGMANEEKLRQADAERQYWLDQATRAKIRSGAAGDISQEYKGRADRTQANEQALWTGIGQVGGTIAGAAMGAPGGGSAPGVGGTSAEGEAIWKKYGAGRAHGGIIEGEAQVKGDHPANDIILTPTSPGEAVIPRSIMQSKDAPENAKLFLKLMMKLQNEKKS